MRVDNLIILFFGILMLSSVVGNYTAEINNGVYVIYIGATDLITPSFDTPDYETWNTTTVDYNTYSAVSGLPMLIVLAIIGVGILAIMVGTFSFR